MSNDAAGCGPLSGVGVVELAGAGPAPYAATMLADLGADVIRIARPPHLGAVIVRGRPTWNADLKDSDDLARMLMLVERTDVLIEGYRPGVMERLGLGPQECTARNPRLIYARMTGWGQYGPRAGHVGHDINYLGLTGALHAIGERGRKPVVPLNLVADYGGGGMLLLLGIVSALYERAASGVGQLIDTAMVDGVCSLLSLTWSDFAEGAWKDERASNVLDGGAPYYDTYECADGRFVAVGAIEAKFYSALGQVLGVELPPQNDRTQWAAQRRLITDAFRSKPRSHWQAIFDDVDACVSPVLSLAEAAMDPHLRARAAMVDDGGRIQPGVAPRLSRTPGRVGEPGSAPGPLTADVLDRWGVDPARWATPAADAG